MSTYPTQPSVLKNLPLLEREQLVQQFRGLKTMDMKNGHKLDLVLVEKRNDNYYLQLDKLLVKIYQNHPNEPVKIQYHQMGNPLLVRVDNNNLLFRSSRIVFPNNDHVKDVPHHKGATVEEAARNWLANYLNRPNTKIGWLALIKVAADFCAGFQIVKVSILDLEYAKVSGAHSLLTDSTEVRLIRCGYENMLHNDTIKAGQHVMIPETYGETSPHVFLGLGCLRLELKRIFELDIIQNICRTITQNGKPLGYKCSSGTRGNMEYGTLDWLCIQMHARKTQILGRKSITMELVTDPTLELNLRNDPLDSYILWIEVDPRGTATDRAGPIQPTAPY